jgi:dTDP-glucose pyrophosphorylase
MRNEYEITDSIQIFLDDGYKVEAAEVVKADMNVSYPADLLQLNLLLLQQSGQSVFRGNGVQFGRGAELSRCVVMDGARIGDGAQLHECLLFPGANVPADRVRQRTIFTADAEIRCGGEEA